MVIRGPWGQFRLNYILNADKEPVSMDDVLMWGMWMETADRIVKQEDVGPFWVSTVFLGIDHGHLFYAPRKKTYRPVLFETMVFNGSGEDRTVDSRFGQRYCTWQEAEAGHAEAVAMVKAYIGEKKLS
jgi:hypothetical protein